MSRLEFDRIVETDLLVVGSGLAGLSVALGAGPLACTVLTKKQLGRGSSSNLAQGGMAVAWGPDDSPELHAGDTLAVGGGISESEAVTLTTSEGPRVVARLLEMGSIFDADETGRLSLGREAAHSRRRILHANGDATGAALVAMLAERARRSRQIHLVENCFACALVVREGAVQGVFVREEDGSGAVYLAPATVLASGGIGAVFEKTTNPPESTGDGLAMAARAGARLADLEFVQFHPTALDCGDSPLPLLTEALRGEGAILVDGKGRRFMPEEHPLAELAPRDVVARAIWRRRQAGDRVFLDAREAVGDAFPERFPTVFGLCTEHGFDPRRERLPVCPAAHYHIGGVATDLRGRTSLPGLWACGECAATGLHGANRLASNSLLEALVFGDRVVSDIRAEMPPRRVRPEGPFPALPWAPPPEGFVDRIRRIMWEKVGLLRDAAGLSEAIAELSGMEEEARACGGAVYSMATTARLVACAALDRRESRGVHFRSDFPEASPDWERRSVTVDHPESLPRCGLA